MSNVCLLLLLLLSPTLSFPRLVDILWLFLRAFGLIDAYITCALRVILWEERNIYRTAATSINLSTIDAVMQSLLRLTCRGGEISGMWVSTSCMLILGVIYLCFSMTIETLCCLSITTKTYGVYVRVIHNSTTQIIQHTLLHFWATVK
jgi:hypothetical protein